MPKRNDKIEKRTQPSVVQSHHSLVFDIFRKKVAARTTPALVRPLTMLSPRNPQLRLPPGAWWDDVDTLLFSLVRDTFNALQKLKEELPPVPSQLDVAGIAIARYEPILGKVPHYFWPSEEGWNNVLTREGSKLDIAQHFANLQAAARAGFSQVPTSRNGPTGTIDILEHLVLLNPRPGVWEKKYRGVRQADSDALVIEDLVDCDLVSPDGQKLYRKDRGCLLLPFMSYDGRLIGEGVVLYGHSLREEVVGHGLLQQEISLWREFVSATFVSLMGSINSALISLIDPFFLIRTREIRRQLAASVEQRKSKRRGIIKDLLILNKTTTYELLDDLIVDRRQDFGVVFFDIDGFKSINQDLGHQRADQLLRFVGQRLADLVSPLNSQWIGRFGGDEFVAIFGPEVKPGEMSASIRSAFVKGLQDFIAQATISTKIKNRLKLTTSLGWVRKSDLNTLALAKISQDHKQLIRSMTPAYKLVELADSEVQAFVKALGKDGWLEFRTRSRLTEKAHENPMKWLKAIRWFSETKERSTALNFNFTPKDMMKKAPR